MKKRKLRKPRGLNTGDIYIDFDDPGGSCLVFIGGRYYTGRSQIHLDTSKQVEALGTWLLKAAAWLRQQEDK